MIETHHKMVQSQDSRILIEFDLKGVQESRPAAEPEIDSVGGQEIDKPHVGEEEIEDLENLFPEEKE